MSIDTAPRMVAPDDARFHEVSNQFGQSRNLHFFYEDDGGPQGYLVDMPADNDVRPHFHQVDQFQLFFGVEGAVYQRTPIRPRSIVVHYADGYATYGPFSTGSEPMQFYTLRAVEDFSIGYMPEDRDKLVHRGIRNLHGDADLTYGKGLEPGTVESQMLIERAADGMGASLLRLGPDTEMTVELGDTSGQYCCVVSGTVLVAGREFGQKALAFTPRGSAPLELRTGPGSGAEVVVMDLPNPPTVDALGAD